jgi:predicted CXXCH cytochrome family protein
MKRIIAILLSVAFLAAGSMTALAAGKGPAEVKLEAKMGTVTFNHAAHQKRVADCKTCHHKSVEAGACRSCHNGKKAPQFKEVAHQLCKGCHKEKSGPTACRDCHKK